MFATVTLALLQGMGELLKIFFLTLLFSLPLGLVIAFALRSRCKPVSLQIVIQRLPFLWRSF